MNMGLTYCVHFTGDNRNTDKVRGTTWITIYTGSDKLREMGTTTITLKGNDKNTETGTGPGVGSLETK